MIILYQNKTRVHRSFSLGPETILVSMSVMLVFESSSAILMTDAATASHTLWYVMELCFLFKVDSSIVVLLTTLLLSQYILAGPVIGIPTIRSL